MISNGSNALYRSFTERPITVSDVMVLSCQRSVLMTSLNSIVDRFILISLNTFIILGLIVINQMGNKRIMALMFDNMGILSLRSALFSRKLRFRENSADLRDKMPMLPNTRAIIL